MKEAALVCRTALCGLPVESRDGGQVWVNSTKIACVCVMGTGLNMKMCAYVSSFSFIIVNAE